MNCKPGDLAIVVRSEVGNAGKIVRCVRLADRGEFERMMPSGWRHGFNMFGPMWVLEQTVLWQFLQADKVVIERQISLADDCDLRPLPGEDEVLEFDRQVEIKQPEMA